MTQFIVVSVLLISSVKYRFVFCVQGLGSYTPVLASKSAFERLVLLLGSLLLFILNLYKSVRFAAACATAVRI